MITQILPASRTAARNLTSVGLISKARKSATRSYISNLHPSSKRSPGGCLTILALTGGVLAIGLLTRPIVAESQVNVEKEQREDIDGVVSGAKGSKKQHKKSEVDAAEDLRGEHGPDAEVQGQYLSLKEVARHNLSQDAWVVVEGKVFDVSDFHKYHPGGSAIIVANAGRDVTEIFKPVHPPKTLENNLPPESFKGYVNPEEVAASATAVKAEQERVASARSKLPPPETMLGLDEIEEAAKSFLSPRVANYYSASSLDGYSTAENRSAFRKCRLLPRIMKNVNTVAPQTTIFGIPSALPIYVSPSSNALLGHPDGELNITRGAAKTGIVQGISAAASFPLEEILDEKDRMDEAIGEKMGIVYQVYLQKDRSKHEAQVREAVERGCQALLLTVDSNVGDLRQSTEKLKGTTGDIQPGRRMDPFSDPPGYHDPTQEWKDLVKLKELAQGVPIYLKGVCHIDDVRKAKEAGLAGCIFSNHGGRQLDQARTGFDSLRQIYYEDPKLCKEIELYIDGGVRRGTDVLQALAFGARGVGLGRPFLYAQAAYGEQGVIRTVRKNEILNAMRLMSVTKIEEIKPSMVECLQEIWK
uniref:L-mandelate dehydrogenase n=1 Tax=Kwoniella bestiolae CBS 10118 TaxID=1296100 RepID=A0A1B9FX73_9TREE|nr:hypothetical protein I302_06349 [Kwoniella bestiolae CBS 10118]OCF23368.1 hypothetical protein I302_06349 [Kwoniella bestiolae CBS 10118]